MSQHDILMMALGGCIAICLLTLLRLAYGYRRQALSWDEITKKAADRRGKS